MHFQCLLFPPQGIKRMRRFKPETLHFISTDTQPFSKFWMPFFQKSSRGNAPARCRHIPCNGEWCHCQNHACSPAGYGPADSAQDHCNKKEAGALSARPEFRRTGFSLPRKPAPCRIMLTCTPRRDMTRLPTNHTPYFLHSIPQMPHFSIMLYIGWKCSDTIKKLIVVSTTNPRVNLKI